MNPLLTDKTALVTGGSSGIGAAVTRTLAREGARVAFVYRRNRPGADMVTADLQRMGVQVLALQADVADFARAQAVVDEVCNTFGSLDILVNNAGANQDKVIWKMTEAMWDEVIATDLKGVFNYIRAAAPVLKAQQAGRIITVSSINALRGKFGQANYAAAKAGVVGMSKSVARELGRFGITVNVVCPGLIETDMIRSMPADFKHKALEEIVMGRIGAPEDVAELIAFLASDRARHITGEVIKIDGGQYI